MRPLGVEPGQDRRPGGGELAAQAAHRRQHPAQRRRLQGGSTIRAVQVIQGTIHHPQRLRDTRRPLLISDAHPRSPPPRRITVPGPPGTYTPGSSAAAGAHANLTSACHTFEEDTSSSIKIFFRLLTRLSKTSALQSCSAPGPCAAVLTRA